VSMIKRHCPISRLDFDFERDYTKAVKEYLEEAVQEKYRIVSYPDAKGYYEIEEK